MKFEDLGLSENIMKAIAECGYTQPTPIQAQAIPYILMKRDVVGLAQTGTGKTAGFTLPMIEMLAGGRAKARMPRSLVLSPTRELAAQIAQNFDTYGKHSKLSKALLIGGSSMEEQIKILERGADVLIATPGRLLDLFGRGNILLNDIKILVIDEADRMLDMGFIPDIEKICSLLPPIRQTLLFSATMPPEIKRLTAKFLSSPKEVAVAPPATTSATVEMFLAYGDSRGKKELLHKILVSEKIRNAFIFCNRKRDVDSLASWLKKKGYQALALHGDMAQAQRTETLAKFKDGTIPILVCSDVAARGLDVIGVSHVFNYDVPHNPDDFVHRIGRTGRAGQTGRAWTLATREDAKLVQAIEKNIKGKLQVSDIGKKSQEAEDGPDKEKSPGKTRGGQVEHLKTGGKTPKKSGKPADSARNTKPSASVKEKDGGRDAETETSKSGFGDDIPAFFQSRK
ncbi:MAG: DEAD/DEAH box helicase [Alphaproteobacteria bacterium]|nr:DEAD/DEAH box helicase [Alphaproteobacteria bacterium]